MTTELDRAERAVEERSVALKKPLGLRDLVLTQILFVVGSSWVGTAAKLGQAHLFFWLLAILLFYIPQAAVVIYLSRSNAARRRHLSMGQARLQRVRRIYCRLESLAAIDHRDRARRNVYRPLTSLTRSARGAAWMPDSKWCVSLISAALVGGLGWTCVRGLSLGKWLHNVGAFAMLVVYAALILLPFVGLARGELKAYQPLQLALPAMSIFYCFNIFTKLAVGALSGFEYVSNSRRRNARSRP